jgi:hypothetical protein
MIAASDLKNLGLALIATAEAFSKAEHKGDGAKKDYSQIFGGLLPPLEVIARFKLLAQQTSDGDMPALYQALGEALRGLK